MLGVCPAPRDTGRFVDSSLQVRPCVQRGGERPGEGSSIGNHLLLYHPFFSNDRRNGQEEGEEGAW